MGSDLDPEPRRSPPCRPPSGRWSPSAGRWRSSPTSWSSTSRPRRCPRPTSSACSATLAPAARQRHRHHLRHPPARRGLPHRRPGHGAARRPPRRHGRRRPRRRPRAPGRDDRRPLDERRLRQAGCRHRAHRPGGRGRWSPSMSGRSRSPSPPARRSAWSACAAPATTRSAGPSSARSRWTAGHVLLDGRRVDPADPGRRHAQGRSASSRAGGPRRASPPTWRCARTST